VSQAREPAWSPLREPAFRALWIASVVSNVGTWMQNVGVAWLMTTLTPSPVLVALIQTATTLPVFLVGLPAGALADLIDRRRLLLVSQSWMLLAAAALSLLTLANLTTPITLLMLTFALGLGGAINSPAWQAIVPELVPRRQLQHAVALNGAGFNLARAVGPAIGGLLVAAAGPGPVFMLNAFSFLATIVVLFRWQRTPRPPSDQPAERLFGATLAGLRYVRFSPRLRALLARSAIFVVCASALWALLPVVARQRLGLDSSGYGVLLACLGLGAVAGAFGLPRLQALVRQDVLVAAMTLVFGLTTIALGWIDSLPVLMVMLAVAGLAWLTIMSSFNVAAQTIAPAWVSARVLSAYLLVSQGGLATGSFVWGSATNQFGLPIGLGLAGVGLCLGILAALPWPLEQPRLDLRPSVSSVARPLAELSNPDRGPVLITVEYRIAAVNERAFVEVMQDVRVVRRRDGASRWGLYQDPAHPERYVETFLVSSWAEHLRQHERGTMADTEIKDRARDLSTSPPVVTHLLAAQL
jgi:MFS family permease